MQASQLTGELHLPLAFHVHESCLLAGARLGAIVIGCSGVAVAFAGEELMLVPVYVAVLGRM